MVTDELVFVKIAKKRRPLAQRRQFRISHENKKVPGSIPRHSRIQSSEPYSPATGTRAVIRPGKVSWTRISLKPASANHDAISLAE